MPTLRNVLTTVRKKLRDRERLREAAQKEMRSLISVSKHAILLVHQKRVEEARGLIEKARATLSDLWDLSAQHPETVYCGSFSAALQEYAEANIFLKLVEGSKFPTPEEVRVLPADFVLGLADVIGEYRRLALDALREGDVIKAEDCLRIMDEVYIELMAMDESYMLVQGLRRKCDIARKIIEATRGDLTEEIRRDVLNKHLKELEKKLKSQIHS